MKTFIVDPLLRGDVTIGSPGTQERIRLGSLAEHGARQQLWLGADQEFVALVVGKRGSGKSYTLGSIVEGFATVEDSTDVSSHQRRRGVLLLDPMGNFWTMANAVVPDGTSKVAEQHALLARSGISPTQVSVTVWLPAGFRSPHDPTHVQDFSVRVADLEPSDLADLIGANLVRDPQGAAIADAYEAVVEIGWTSDAGHVAARSDYSLTDLIDYLEHLRDAGTSDHSSQTLRAVIRSLRGLNRLAVFSGTGTPLTELYRAGHLSILMLPHRVGADLRRVITRLLLRRTLREREEAAQIRQRLSVENLSEAERNILLTEIENRIPRSMLALDEAQELLGDEGGEARKAIEDFCLLGRNYGLSLVLATQRPTAGAISAKVRSQADIQLIHRLLTQDDIEMARNNLLAPLPKEMRVGDRNLDFATLVRELDRGQMVVSSSSTFNEDDISRIMIVNARPRLTVHGGEVE